MNLFFCLTGLLLAEESYILSNDDVVDEVVVSRSYAATQRDSLYNAYTYNQKDIEGFAPLDIAALASSLPGVHVAKRGRNSLASIALRGGEANFTVINIDGIQVNDPTNSRGGFFDLSLVDPDTVGTFELVQGGLSTLYGSDALSGVINIISRRPDYGFSLDFKNEIGSSGLSRHFVGVSYGAKAFDVSLRGGLSKSSELGTNSGEIERQFVNAKTSGYFNDLNYTASVQYTTASGDRFPADSGGPNRAESGSLEIVDSEFLVASVQTELVLSSSTKLRSIIGYTDFREKLDTPAIPPAATNGLPASISDSNFKRSEVVLLTDYQLSSALNTTIGVSYEKEDGVNESTLDFGFPVETGFSLSRDSFSIFAGGEWTIDTRLSLSGGVRHDIIPQFANRYTGGLSLRAAVLPAKGELSVLWGRGFKLPSFFALGNPLVGNSELKPEQSNTIEVAVIWPIDKIGSLKFSVFKNTFRDLVEFDAQAFRIVNLSNTTASGFELHTELDITSSLNTSLNLSFVDTDIVGDPARSLQQRPEWLVSGNLKYDYDSNLSISTSWRYVDNRTDFSIPTGFAQLGGYFSLNLASSYMFDSNTKLTVAVDNVFDSSYEETIGYTETLLIRGALAFKW